MDVRTCRWCARSLRPAGNTWVHEGLTDAVYCLAGLLRSWLVPRDDPGPAAGWGSDAIGAELAAAERVLGEALDGLVGAADHAADARATMSRIGSASLACEFERLQHAIEAHCGEIHEIGDQLTPLIASAASAARQPTPHAVVAALTTLLTDIGTLALAVLCAPLLSSSDPLADHGLALDPPRRLLTEVGQARNRLGDARTHLDRAREAVAATLTAVGRSGGAP